MDDSLNDIKSNIHLTNDDNPNTSIILQNETIANDLNIDSLIIENTDLQNSLNSPPVSPSIQLGSVIQNYNNVSTHTFKKTEWDVKKLENYVKNAYCDHTAMENMQPDLLNRYLISFFEFSKKSDGMDYEPESLIGFMNSFERYLKTKSYPESLLRSEIFKDARTLLKKKRDLVRSIGKLIRTKTTDTSYLLQFHRNLLKEKSLLNRDNPDCLLAEIYLNNMIFFGEHLKEDKAWRGNLNLVWGDMVLDKDPQNGLEYLTLATHVKKTGRNQSYQTGVVKMTARSKTGSSNDTPRLYAQRQPITCCPIEAYKIYRTRRPNNCLDRDSPFYLAPLYKLKNQSKVWYKALAMSCQRLDALFYCLFRKAGVDLNSLADMSQQQQQQQQQKTLNTTTSTNTSTQAWNQVVKHSHSETENSSLITTQINENTISVPGTSSSLGHQINANNYNNYHQHTTIVPAQIQVQITVQVPHPQNAINTHLQNIDTTNNTESNLLTTNSVLQNNQTVTYAVVDGQNCV